MPPAILNQLIYGFVFAAVIFLLSIVPAAATEFVTKWAAGYKKWTRRGIRTLIFFVFFGFEVFCLERASINERLTIYQQIILIFAIPLRS